MFRYPITVIVMALGIVALPAADPQNEDSVKPVNLDKLNTAADEDDPFLGSNSLALYYACKADKTFELLCSQRRNVSFPWVVGKPPESYLDPQRDTRSVFATPEGYYPQYLYYATRDKEEKNFDVYVMVKQSANAAFSAPTPVQTVCTADDEMHPWLTGGGKQLYFSRKTKEGWRVFVATRKEVTGGGGFGEPVLVKELPADFHHATLTTDAKSMYLQGPLEKGRVGLFRSTWDGKAWTKPDELTELNQAEATVGDKSPALSRDGSLLYFASDRAEGKGGLDLWVVPITQLKRR